MGVAVVDQVRGRVHVIGLERDVRDAMPCEQRRAKPAGDLMTVVRSEYQDVRGQRGLARSELPDVQVVQLGYAVDGGEFCTDLGGVDPGRRRLEEHPSGR